MSFYHDIITQKSWEELTTLRKKIEFVLIGGWAVYLYTKSLKSKDIDILIEFGSLGKLNKYYDVSKNERLYKYEARHEEVQIDVYIPHYSKLGIPVVDLMDKTSHVEGFRVLKKEWLFILKIYTLSLRKGSAKGEKDFLDIVSLFISGIDNTLIHKIIKEYGLEKEVVEFFEILKERTEVPELDLNTHAYKKIKLKVLDLFPKLRSF